MMPKGADQGKSCHIPISCMSLGARDNSGGVIRPKRHTVTTTGGVPARRDFLSGRRFAEAVRGHWGIENSLHGVLDVTFDEDHSRTRVRHMADHFSWLRRFAISLLKRHPSNHRIKGKSEMAGWNNEFLMEVLTEQGFHVR